MTDTSDVAIGEILHIDDETTDVYVKVNEIRDDVVYFSPVTIGATIDPGATVESIHSFLTVKYKGEFYIVKGHDTTMLHSHPYTALYYTVKAHILDDDRRIKVKRVLNYNSDIKVEVYQFI